MVLSSASPELHLRLPAATAPSTPRGPFHARGLSAVPFADGSNPFERFSHAYTSAPASPSRAAVIYAHIRAEEDEYDDDDSGLFTSSTVPFSWEEKPGTPKSRALPPPPDSPTSTGGDSDFEFSGAFKNGNPPPEPTTADELFESGRVRPLNPPPRLHVAADGGGSLLASSPRSPRRKGPGAAWSPRRRSGADPDAAPPELFDPFVVAMVKVSNDAARQASRREALSRSAGGGGGGSAGAQRAQSKSWSGKKWRLSNLFLFRSASEGRTGGDHRSKLSTVQKPQAPAPVVAVPAAAAKKPSAMLRDEWKKFSFRNYWAAKKPADVKKYVAAVMDDQKKYAAAAGAGGDTSARVVGWVKFDKMKN